MLRKSFKQLKWELFPYSFSSLDRTSPMQIGSRTNDCYPVGPKGLIDWLALNNRPRTVKPVRR